MPSDLQHLQLYATSGDAHAFRELVQAHGAMVHATALRVTRDVAAAQDVAQETFLELARKASGITQSVAAWLHRVAWNRACDAVRRESTRKRVEEAMAQTWHTDREATWPDIEPHVDASLNELPNELREVLVLYFLEGRTQAEVARHLGKNQATVSRAIERGISAMREALRSRGVIAGAGLAALFAAQGAQAMPVAMQASLGKLSVGLPASVSVSSMHLLTATFITMTTTTKVLIGSTAVATIAFFMAPKPEAKKPAAPPFVSAAKSTRDPVVASKPELKRYRPEVASSELQQRVDEFIRKFEGLPFERMMASFEFEEAMQGMAQFLESPANQKMIREAVEEIKKAKKMDHGTLNIAIDTEESLGSPKNRALIEASMSRDPKKIEGWLRGALEGAIFEYSYDPDLKKTAGSISVQPTDAPEPLDRE
jgi:RNA polymerase sigma factor (sigma-70 family)